MNKSTFRCGSEAIEAGDVESLESLFASDPTSLTLVSPFGTWLHYAAMEGQLRIAQLLVNGHRFDVNAGDANGQTALCFAASNGHYEVAKYLLEQGATMDTSASLVNPLFSAILGGEVRIGQLLIDRGIDTTVRYFSDTMNGMSALDFAKERGATTFVDLLEREEAQNGG